ncbi:MAG: cobalt ECF transporter T component CbiQ [Deltaproteobacteria bacterium]|nr:cobalt ECF transporter T component CbiQ [Deltaproteobacteria bacterium]MBW2086309.1 cobalt ECF transporter T component CbiQ [Deltaproteobacteria bacterium]
MNIEEFSSGSSFIHRLDPRVKIVATALFSAVVAAGDSFIVLGTALGAAVTLIALARLNPKAVGSRLLIVNTFILLLWLILPFSYPGETIFTIGPLRASEEGVSYAAVITIKSNAIILTLIALLATSSVFTLVHALRHLRLPGKLVQLLFFTFRYFHVMHQEYLRLRDAMRIRCFKARTNYHTYRSLAYLVGMLLVRSFDHSERVHQAMILRGYQGKFWLFDHFALKTKDLLFLAVMTLFISALAVGQWSNLLP